MMMATSVTMIEQSTGKSWLEDYDTFMAVKTAWELIARRPPRDVNLEGDIAFQEFLRSTPKPELRAAVPGESPDDYEARASEYRRAVLDYVQRSTAYTEQAREMAQRQKSIVEIAEQTVSSIARGKLR